MPRIVTLRNNAPGRSSLVVFAALLGLAALAASQTPLISRRVGASARPSPATTKEGARLVDSYSKLPMRFEVNRGQARGDVLFTSRGPGYSLQFTRAGAVLSLGKGANTGAEEGDGVSRQAGPSRRASTLKLGLVGAKRSPEVVGVGELTTKSNYFIGADPRAWRAGVENYGAVRYEGVYKGVDLVYYGNGGRLEYDFLVAPGADPARIRMSFEGARGARVEEGGDLVLTADGGDVRMQKPFAYQEFDGRRVEVPARFVKEGRRAVRFALGRYDRSRPLVIDPVLLYSSYLGGFSVDQGLAVAVDSAGSAYVAGSTASADFPTAGAAFQGTKNSFSDAFVLKLAPDGKSLVYATYLGGNGDDTANALAVDSAGNAYVSGSTGSGSFPTTPGAFQTSKEAGLDAFITKLNPAGSSLVYSTLLGGNGNEQGLGIAADGAGAAYVVGRTDSFNFTRIPIFARAGNPVQKSTDGGATWTGSAAGLTASIVNDFAVAQGSPNTVYAGTNLGVYKSTDGGANWQLTGQSRTSTAPPFTRTVVVDPTNPSVVYAGTNGGAGLYKSTDGGNLYEIKANGLFVPLVNSLAIDPSTPSTLYAGTTFGIYKTTNGGDNWTEISFNFPGATPGVTEMVVDPSSPQTVYAATSQGVYKTTNGGVNWVPANNGLSNNGFTPQPRALVMDPSQPSTLYVALSNSSSAVFKTTDGGANWTSSGNGLSTTFNAQTFPLTVNALLVDPASPSTLYAGTNGFGLYRSTDGGANWAPSTGITNRVVLALASRPGTPAAVLAGLNVGADAFALKLDPSGSAPEYLRLLGGTEEDSARGVAVGPGGAAYVTGVTNSGDFPVANPLQAASGGGADAYLVKLDSTGASLFSTYFGGSSFDQGLAVAAGPDGAAYVAGSTVSDNFPVAAALQPARGDGFASDAFVTKFAPDGQSLIYSTYFGGDSTDQALGLAVGADGSAHLTGNTASTNFPTTGPTSPVVTFNDAFVSKLNPAGSSLVYSNLLSGSSTEQGNGVAVDAAGNIYVAGTTASPNFPVVNALRGSFGGGTSDAFVAKIGPDADLSITMEESFDPVMAEGQLTYTLTVTNAGPDTAAGVVVTDTLPLGTTFASSVPSQGTCSGTAPVTCNLGDLAAGASATINITVSPQSPDTLTNTATVTSSTPDSKTANNSATQQTRVSTLPSIAGRVTAASGVGLGSVNMALTGTLTATTTTSPGSGFYQFAELPARGSYTVTPSLPGWVFHPQSQSFPDLVKDERANFTAVECVFQLSASNATFTAAGGQGSVTVTAPDGLCPWTASSNVPWINVTSAPTGTGTATVTFSVAPTARSRSGTLTVGGRVFTVWQEVTPCGAPSFKTAAQVANAPRGFLILTRDFNADGRPDLAVAADNSISVMLGAGGGAFNTSATLPVTGFRFNGMAAGDFNGDGKQDIASTSNAGGGFNGFVTLRLGDGAGGFGQPLDFSVGVSPTLPDTGDFDGDGRDDLAVGNFDSGTISILLGSASGGFAPPKTVGAGATMPQLQSVAVGDYNKDGRKDVATLGAFGVHVLLGDGAGGFGTPKLFSSGVFNTFDLAAGDVDGDGDDDLAVAGNNLTVLKSDGAGNFAAPVLLISGRMNTDVIISDFNGDGRRDVASANFTGGEVSVFISDASGGFSRIASYLSGVSARALAAADFDDDGKKDLMTVDGSTPASGGGVHLMKGDGAGGFRAPRDFFVVAPTDAVAADFNLDGRPDLVVANGNGTVFGNIYFVPGGAAGEFGDPVLLNSDLRPRSLGTADFNLDGKPDLSVVDFDPASNGSISRAKTYLGDGLGGFTQASDVLIDSFNQFVLYADYNGDGKLDMVSGGPSFGLAFRAGDGAGNFGPRSAIAGSALVAKAAAGDFDGDGRADFVVATQANGGCGSGDISLHVFRGNGAGNFAAPVTTPFNGSAVNLLPHDFNGDGRSDLALINGCAGKLNLLTADAAGRLAVAGEFDAGVKPSRLALGDFNGDGRPDLAVTNGESFDGDGQISILSGDGVGGFAPPVRFRLGGSPSKVVVADFDLDGRDDLAATDLPFNHVGVLLNSCHVALASSTVQFGAVAFAAGEGDGAVQITVTRSGDRSGPASVNYATQRGAASPRTDYTTAVGTLQFAPGEASKSFQVLLTDDAFVEGTESLTVSLNGPAGTALGVPNNVPLHITDNDTAAGPNPIDNTAFFVRQHYHDFFSREPDAPGLAHWTNVIDSCGSDAQCREVNRVNVSGAFFLSIEFTDTGYLVERAYKAAYGDAVGNSTLGGTPHTLAVPIIRLEEFIPDTQRIGRGVVVLAPGWEAQLESNKQAYFLEFVQRPRFTTAFPSAMTPAEFVGQLNQRAGNPLDATERQNLIDELTNNNTTAGRASVLRKVAEDSTLAEAEKNRAFVLMQYFGYLRRNPNDPPDSDHTGYDFWLGNLERFNGNFVRAELVKAFISSDEYRKRFGQ